MDDETKELLRETASWLTVLALCEEEDEIETMEPMVCRRLHKLVDLLEKGVITIKAVSWEKVVDKARTYSYFDTQHHPFGVHNRIATIKAYRELTGNGLKESKDAVQAEARLRGNFWT